jgi:hypothetical protein
LKSEGFIKMRYAEILDGPMPHRLETQTLPPPVNTERRADPPPTDAMACYLAAKARADQHLPRRLNIAAALASH